VGVLVDRQEALALLCECVNIKTANPPGDEARLTDVLAERLRTAGLAAETHILAPGRANLLARLPGTGERPALILSGHTDTVGPGAVPWQNDPWSGRIVGDRIYGLGTCDMKSGLAAMAMAMILLRRASVRLRGDLVLAASAGEEVDGLGALAFVASGAVSGAGAMVVGEPTGGEVAVAHKGGALLVFTTSGRTAHGSMPEQGVNAIVRMQQVIGRLQTVRFPGPSHPLLGTPTLSINTIRGGDAVNVVPDRCSIHVDMRTVPGQDHDRLVESVRAAVDGLGFPVDVAVAASLPPVETDPGLPIVQTALDVAARISGQSKFAAALPYGTDASIYQPALGIPVIIYGPGEARLAHQPDEWVAVPKYQDAIRFYVALAQAYLT
jgi:succinyl-diaminopimelate desuccinylase